MIELTLKEILKATGGRAVGEIAEQKVGSITTDSRRVGDGAVFIALAGERVDGHSFIKDVEKDVVAVVAERETDVAVPQIIVPSTYRAVGDIGAYIREKSGVTVVGVTGSVGKTSVKELTACVLSQRYNVLKTEKNHNNELGLPMTLFRLEPRHEVAVLEMGISYFGEMTRIARIARPDIAIYTNIENVHTENLGSRDGVLRAKTELVPLMRGDTLILNGEDDKLAGYELPEGKRAIYYGVDGDFFAKAENIVFRGLDSTAFTLVLGDRRIEVELPASGRHMVIDCLAAASAGSRLGLSMEEIKCGLESYVAVDGRMSKKEHKGAVIIDDCYNAGPASMKASLSVLAKATGRKLALLGDMLELGERSELLHEEVGKSAAEAGVDILVTVGERAEAIAKAASLAGLRSVYHLGRDEAAAFIKAELRPGDTLLVKASRGMALEKIIKLITEE